MAAPKSLLWANETLKNHPNRPRSYRFSGIEGDANHGGSGYHCSLHRLDLPDYSYYLSKDVKGANQHPTLASAWDLSFNPSDMILVTKRLKTAALNGDPRMKSVREFCGTLNGYQTWPFDLSNMASEGINSWDSSHLWHEHISIYRDMLEDRVHLHGLIEVICGVPLSKSKHFAPATVPYTAPKFPLAKTSWFSPTRNARHKSVRTLQLRLVKLGAVKGVASGTAGGDAWTDGYYGPETAVALVAWKRAHNFKVINNKTGPVTWSRLFNPKFK